MWLVTGSSVKFLFVFPLCAGRAGLRLAVTPDVVNARLG